MPVTLINAFEMPVGDEPVFLEHWKRTSEQAETKPGFIETKLHSLLRDDARFSYVSWLCGRVRKLTMQRSSPLAFMKGRSPTCTLIRHCRPFRC